MGNIPIRFGVVTLKGYAQGQLVKEKGQQFIQQTWAYMEGQIDAVVKFLPAWLQNMIANFGSDFIFLLLLIVKVWMLLLILHTMLPSTTQTQIFMMNSVDWLTV